MDKFDCVVIGAGAAGLGAAAKLAKAGMKPLVIERHNSPGGSASSFVRGRFEFETSLHLWIEAQMAPAVRGELGMTDEVCNITCGNDWVYRDSDGTVRYIDLPKDYPGIKDALKKLVPGQEKSVDDLIDISAEMVGALLPMDGMTPEEINKMFPHLEEFSKYTVHEAFEKLGTPKILQDIYTVPWFFEGPSNEKTNFARWAAVFFVLFTQPTQFPACRTYGVWAELEAIIRQNGGDVWYNTEVSKINVENGQVTGVETSRGDNISTDIIISGTAPKEVYGDLIADRKQVKDETFKLHNSLVDNISFFNIYMGLDVSAQELGFKTWQIFACEDRDVNKAMAASYTLEGPYSYDILCYNVAMPDWSPEGTCIVCITIPMRGVAFEGMNQKEYMKAKDRITEHAVKAVEEMLGMDLVSHIEELEVATAVTLARYNGHRFGSLGYEMSPTNVMPVRNLVYDQEHYIKGLYLTGQFENAYGIDNIVNGAELGARIVESVKGGK